MGKQSIQAKKVYREEKLLHHVAMVANYLGYSLDDNHTVNLYFQSTSMHVFPAAVSIKCSVGRHDVVFILVHVFESYWLKPRLRVFSLLSSVPSFLKEPIENFRQNSWNEKGV